MSLRTVEGTTPGGATRKRPRTAASGEGRRDEVASAGFRAALALADTEGVSAAQLLEGLPFGRSELEEARRRFAWDDYVTVLDRLARATGGEARLEALGEKTPEVLPEMRALTSGFVHPMDLYRFVLDSVVAATFPMVRMELREIGPLDLDVTASLLDGYRESLPFFAVLAGRFRSLPRHLDLPQSRVVVQSLSGRQGIYRVTLPDHQRLAGRLKRRARILARRLFWPAAIREMEGDKRELLERLRQLAGAHAAVEARRRDCELEAESRQTTERALLEALSQVRCAAFLVGGGEVQAANELAGFALHHEGAELRRRLLGAVDGTPDGDFKVSRLASDGRFLVMRTGVEDLVEQRLHLAVKAWGLTPRQADVLRGLVDGLGNKEIARELSCTVKTVEAHVTALLDRADADSRLSVVAAFWADL